MAGLDEAGRGPLAGPVVASAVIILDYKKIKDIKKINDSKKLSEKQREELYKIITRHPQIKWGVGIVSEKVIDKINILEASKLAMQKSLQQAQGRPKLNADFLLLDGNFTLRQARGKKYIPQKPIIKGDSKVMSIAMASIIAKVTRDRIMQKYHKKYPGYGFSNHKGYPTAAHFACLEKLGPCKIHRRSFYPVNSYPQGVKN